MSVVPADDPPPSVPPGRIRRGALVATADAWPEGELVVRSGRVELRLPGLPGALATLGPGSSLGDLRPLLAAGLAVTVVVVSEEAVLVPAPSHGLDPPASGTDRARPPVAREGPPAPRVTAVAGGRLAELAAGLATSGRVAVATLPGCPPVTVAGARALDGAELLAGWREGGDGGVLHGLEHGLDHVLVALPDQPTGDARLVTGRAAAVVAFEPAAGWVGWEGTGRPVVRVRGGAAISPRLWRFLSGRGVGLALSGGGSKAVAHIGLIGVLRDAGIEIDAVVGTSGGALVAAAVAFDRSQERMMGMVRELAESTRLRRFDYHLIPRSALFKGARLRSLFDRWYAGAGFADSAIPWWVVASDLATGEEVVIDSGPVADGMRASMAIPGVLDPWPLHGRLLLDGVAVNPLPASVLRAAGAGLVIASDVASGEGPPGSSESPHLLRMVSRMMHSMERQMIRGQLGLVDFLISTDLRAVHSFDFSRAEEFEEAGATAARLRLPELRRLLAGPS